MNYTATTQLVQLTIYSFRFHHRFCKVYLLVCYVTLKAGVLHMLVSMRAFVIVSVLLCKEAFILSSAILCMLVCVSANVCAQGAGASL